jgi:uncharacterized protein (TIGR00255 family)
MTGFGKGVAGNFKVEIRSVNHKNLDIQLSIPPYMYSYEPEIKKLVKQMFERGRIDIYVPRLDDEGRELRLNIPVAKRYYDAFAALKEELSLSGDISLELLSSQRDIFLMNEPAVAAAEFFNALDMALKELEKSRIEEGMHLADDIMGRLALLKKYLNAIENKRLEVIAGAKAALLERLKELLGNAPIDESRVIQEVAIMIEKSDITEEIVRAGRHLKSFEELINSDDPSGKKMDFIIQELRREANTIGSKTSDIEIAENVIEMKHEVEKVREQVQNIQ